MDLKELKNQPKMKINEIRSTLNLTDEEMIVFDDAMRCKSRTYTAMRIGCCDRTIGYMREKINKKLRNLELSI